MTQVCEFQIPRRSIVFPSHETLSALRLHILKPTVILSILSALALIAFYIHAVVESNPYQSRATSALVEGILLLIMVVWYIWIQRREAKLTATEMVSRIQSIVEDVRVHGVNQKQVHDA